ncbi:hypothetical protein H4S08_002843 [Coemansia sp. RSA 1365]|nr:hypothetical protein H4S08_002843 [Coemansia sp. RSA 1365]
MTQVKRPRLSTSDYHTEHLPDISGFCLSEKIVLDLPPDIGATAAIAVCPSVNTESHTDDSMQNGYVTIAIGTHLGCIALVHSDQTTSILEGPGGPAIQKLLALEPTKHDDSTSINNETKLSTKTQCGVVAGDAEGRITTYFSGRMFSRKTYAEPISALAPDCNPNTPSSFLVGDMSGTVINCHAQGVAWKAQIDISTPSNPARSVLAGKESKLTDLTIRDVCSVQLPDRHGLFTNYVLVASGTGHVQLLSRGVPVHTIALSAPCNALCPGVFLGSGTGDKVRLPPTRHNLQAMIGDDAGRLFVLDGFELVPYAQLDYPITRVFSLPLRAFGSYDGPDVVICATRSDSIYILYQKKIVATHVTGFWPAAVNIIPAFLDAGPAIAVVESQMRREQGRYDRVHIILLEPTWMESQT